MENLAGLTTVLGINKGAIKTGMRVGSTLGEYTKNALKNHTVVGRMIQGDSLTEAIKNDFSEDLMIGGLLSGKSFGDSCKAYLENGSGLGAIYQVGKSIFS